VVLFAALVLQLSQEDAIRKLIEQLSSDKIEERAAAFRKLEEVGRPALPLLEKAAKDSDGEVSTRARSLLLRIPIREHLTPALVAAFEGIYDRLALGDWLPVFLALAADLRLPAEERRYRGVRAEDLAYLAPIAVEAAKSETDRITVCQAVGRLGLKGAIPAVADLLKDEAPAVRSNAIGAIRDTKSTDRSAAVRALLADPSPIVRSVAADALGKLGDRESVPALRGLLKDPVSDVRWWTVHALGELRATEAREDLERLAEDPEESVRRVARDTVAQLRREP
jgi:HEAT repeat protein